MTDQTVNIMRGLKRLDPDRLVSLHNEYCAEHGLFDGQFLTLDEETIRLYFSDNILKLIKQVTEGRFDENDVYFRVNVFDEFLTYTADEAAQELDFEALAEFAGQDEYLLIDLLGEDYE